MRRTFIFIITVILAFLLGSAVGFVLSVIVG
jgi:hypothetical protein